MKRMTLLKSVAGAAVLAASTMMGSEARALFIDFAKVAQDAKSTLGREYLWRNLNSNSLLNNNGEFISVGAGRLLNNGGTIYYEQGGIRVTASGTGSNSRTDAYLDGLDGDRPAGIGACASNNCSGLDNIAQSAGEEVTVSFFDLANNPLIVTLVSSEHTDANHRITNIGTFNLGGMSFTPSTGTTVSGYGGNRKSVDINKMGTSFTWDATSGELYLSGLTVSVPEPATLGVLGVGLVGLGFAARRRREKAS